MRALLAPWLLMWASALSAQQTYDNVLSIQQGGKETGREEYSIQRGTAQSATVIKAQARYPATSPTLQIALTEERSPTAGIAKFELDVQAPEGNVVILAAGSGARLIVRSVTKGSEAGRELPGGRDLVLLDEQVYSLYLQLVDAATPSGARLTAVYPRTGRRATVVARRDAGPGGIVQVQMTGDVTGTLTVDTQGRLQRLELPGTGIVVVPVVAPPTKK
jgi:hypothetical protein